MARIKSPTTFDVEVTRSEVALLRRALRLVNVYGDDQDADPALELLDVLSEVDE
ncbi:hypothetical protein [Streptomyces sp. NBC_00239]|uniref:hypothetical protein n=1 Tax=Streptomyces sp. NBC_00239 TaxID=2903640 RepID=UPI002E28AD2F|nr:hypothetical protein [Streptomyces sp. NBC_00239]